MKIEICKPQDSDLPRIWELLQDVSNFHPKTADPSQILNEFRKQQVGVGLVAKSDGLVIGFGSILICSRIRGGRVGYIEDVVVSKDHRGLGIGKNILSSLKEVARSRACHKIVLQTTETAGAFYLSNGFTVNGLGLSLKVDELLESHD